MEPELSGIFWVKIVAKNKVLGSTGTHFMHMRLKKNIFSVFRKAGKLINWFLNNRGKNTTLDVFLEMQIVCCFKSQEYQMLSKTHTPKANLLSQFDIIHIGWLTCRFISYFFCFTITGNIFLVQSYYLCQILC